MHDSKPMDSYLTFLEKKRHSIGNAGFDATYIPEIAFDFQAFVIEKAVKRGRSAIFGDTGTGKTLIELSIAWNIIKHTNKRVLILTPLAVAFQFILEAEKLGIDNIEYSKDGKFTKKIVVCNYERLHYFKPDDFVGVICDESSILKNCDGATRAAVTAFVKKIQYRFLPTATPSPNDYIELGTSSEALGHLGYTDMLQRFFKNNQDNTVKATARTLSNAGAEWYLKPHAETAFWQWVSQWAISFRKPSDLGPFSDEGYILPALHETQHIVNNTEPLVVNGQARMFNEPAINFFELKAEARTTLADRCAKAVELASEHDLSFLWCNLNAEGDLLETLLPNSIQIKGQDSIEKKEEGVEWFLGRKCVCDSKFFGLNLKKKYRLLCGNPTTQEIEEQNIKMILTREKDERLSLELQKKIRNTWQTIIGLIEKSSRIKTQKNVIGNDGSVIKIIRNLERSLNSGPESILKKIPINTMNELLGLTVLQLKNITQSLRSKTVSARFVKKYLTELEKNPWGLTIAIKQMPFEECCVPLAISDSDILKTISNHSSMPPCICGHQSGIRRMISKSTIFGFGLNLQHCNHTVFFPTYSYEQYYQAIRRFWRFGQKCEVFVDLVLSDGQTRVMDSLLVKKAKADDMFTKLSQNVNSIYEIQKQEFSEKIIKPKFGAKI